jgi:site-specific DNA-methyltransferase (adenine-specific)
MPPSSCWIVWDKNNFANYADGELAYTSLKTALRIFKYTWNGMLQEKMRNKEIRIHPTQKPVDLYAWVLRNYAPPKAKILYTHLGSGSIAIACYDMGFDLIAYEIDKDYYDMAVNRLENHKKQLTFL